MAQTTNGSDSVTSRTAVGVGWMVAWRMVTRGLGLVSTLILARLLVPADFGLVAIATSFAAAIDALSELGLQNALVRQPGNDPSLYDTAFTMQAARGLITSTVVACGAWWTGSWFGDARLTPLMLILAAMAAISGFDNIAVVRFQRELRFDMEFRLLFVPRVLQFAVTTISAFALRSYWALIVGVAVARLSRTFITYWVQPYRPRLALARWRELAGFSFWSWASSMASMVWERCDAFVLGPALGIGQLGVFLLAGEIGLLPTTELIAPATRAVYAGVAAAYNRGTDPFGLALPLMAVLLMLVLPIGIGISATSGYVVAGLLGPAWAAGRPIISIFALLCSITPVTYVATTILSAGGHVRQNFLAIAGASALRVLALCVVARHHRLDLAALAIFAVVVGEASLFLTQLARLVRLPWRDVTPGMLRTLASCSAVAGLLWLTGLGWHDVAPFPFAALATGGAIGIASIAGCAGLQAVLWIAAGRPKGPEATLAEVVKGLTPKLRRWVGSA